MLAERPSPALFGDCLLHAPASAKMRGCLNASVCSVATQRIAKSIFGLTGF
jgi:hypothetical protein